MLSFIQVTSVVPSVTIFANLMNIKQNTSAEYAIFARYLSRFLANAVAHFMTTYRTAVMRKEF